MTSLFSAEATRGSDYERVRRRVLEVEGALGRLDAMWREFEPYADPNFQDEFREHPHERAWELILGTALLRSGFSLTGKGPAGPDFSVTGAGQRVWIEATAPSSGTGPDAIPEPPVNALFDYPERQIILRLRSAIRSKHEQLQDYNARGLAGTDEPVVIAINGARFSTFIDDEDSPAILKAVLPIGAPQVVINTENGEVIERRMEYRPELHKASGSEVLTTCFLDPAFSTVSAVLFSEANFLMDPLSARDDFIIVHNPLASSPLRLGWFGFGRECLPAINGDTVTWEVLRSTEND